MESPKSTAQFVKISLGLLLTAHLLLTAVTCQAFKKENPAEYPATLANGTNSPVSGRSLEAQLENSDRVKQATSSFQPKPGRSGRMLDLDHLAGDLGKDEKQARDQSLSGNRQSRTLGDDLSVASGTQKPVEGRTKKPKGGKKMSIQGFIPIVSLDSAKDGKQLDGQLESSDDSDDESSAQDTNDTNGSQLGAHNLREQMAASYGGQTSIGHASFPSSGAEQQQQQHWQQLSDQLEAGRANRKLLNPGSIRTSLANSRRLVSNLLPSASSQLLSGLHQPQAYPQFQGPMNVPPVASYFEQQQHQQQPLSGECICVPFFQCKNGFLSESQLSKAQLAQVHSQMSSLVSMHQVPRALPPNDDNQASQTIDLYAGQQQHLGGDGNQQQQQQLNDLIYEQLRKNIEAGNLEQQIQAAYQQQQQQPALSSLIDERSKSGSANTTSELEERSLLNQLSNRRNSAPQKSCGIMRTCCRIPTTMLQQQQQHVQRPLLITGPSPQVSHQFHGAANRMLARPANVQQHYPAALGTRQLLGGPALHDQQLGAASLVQPSFVGETGPLAPNFQQQLQQAAAAVRPQQLQAPSGGFMSGRCGVRQALGISGRVQNAPASQLGVENAAEFGEFPAHAAILKRLSPGDNLFVCSGVLISAQWLATAAHCVRKQARLDELKVRLGEWDVGRDDEFYPFVESNIREIVVHPEFQPSSLANDIALVRLETPVEQQQMPHVAPACLATPDEQLAGQRCWVAGWGKDAFGQQGAFQSVLKKVDLPVVGHHECESALRTHTKLGKFFRLHANNVCAGGERGKDACEGDGGAGLYCQDPQTGLSKAVGLVSWGVGCGQRGVPGVYVNLANFYAWIEAVVTQSGEENVYLDGRQTGAGANPPPGDFRSLINERTMNGTAPQPARQAESDSPSGPGARVGGAQSKPDDGAD